MPKTQHHEHERTIKKEKLPCCNGKMMQLLQQFPASLWHQLWQKKQPLTALEETGFKTYLIPCLGATGPTNRRGLATTFDADLWKVVTVFLFWFQKFPAEQMMRAAGVSLKTRMLESHTILLVASREQERKQCWGSMACWSRHDSWHDGFCWRVVCSQKERKKEEKINIQIAAVRNKKINK